MLNPLPSVIIKCPYCDNDDAMLLRVLRVERTIYAHLHIGGEIYRTDVVLCEVCSKTFRADPAW